MKIEEDARTRVTNTVGTVENWARAIAERQDGGTELEREIDIVRYSYLGVEGVADKAGIVPARNTDGLAYRQSI